MVDGGLIFCLSVCVCVCVCVCLFVVFVCLLCLCACVVVVRLQWSSYQFQIHNVSVVQQRGLYPLPTLNDVVAPRYLVHTVGGDREGMMRECALLFL